jgi:regulator of RNase E activity RraB
VYIRTWFGFTGGVLDMGIFSFFGSFKKRGLDELVLVQLRKTGADIAKPHNIEFFLYFPSQAVDDQAAAHIRDSGFQVVVERSARGDDWLCLATKTMVPDLFALQSIRKDFTNLAASLNGEYDGWGTPVER